MLKDKDGTMTPIDTFDGYWKAGGRIGCDRCDDHREDVDGGLDRLFDIHLLDHVGYLIGNGGVTHRMEGFLLGRAVDDPCLLHAAAIRQYGRQCHEKIG